MNARFEEIEKWAHSLLARPAAYLAYGLWAGFDFVVVWAARAWAWLRRWRHLPEGGVVATVVRDGDKR
jgi:hypothetical protein